MAIRWKMSEKATGLSAVGTGPRWHYLNDGDDSVIVVMPIGGAWNNGVLKGYRFKLLADFFGDKKFRSSTKLFDDAESAKAAAKEYYLKCKNTRKQHND